MWALYDFLSRALLPHHRRFAVLCSETTPSRESRQFDEHPCDGSVSCGRRNPPPANAAIAPAPNNRKSRRVRSRRTRGSILFTGGGRSSKRPCRYSTETDSTATDVRVSLVLDSRCTQSIFALLFIRSELRPFHSS